METPPFIRSFGDNQSSLMDRFERLSFEAHLSNALLGRSLSESGFSSMYNAVLDDSPPVHVENQDCHRVRRGLRLNKMLKNLMKPIRYCSRRISRGKKQEGYDLDARSFKKWQTFSKSEKKGLVVVAGKDQMHTISIPAGDLEKQQDKAPEKQSESVNESATEVNLTIVVCNGDSSRGPETVEVAQIFGPAEREESPKKVCLSRNSSSHEQCSRVCQQEKEEALIELGCLCRGGLAKSHRSCIDAWFRTKGSNQCEICQAVAVNVPPPETQPTTNYWVWRIDPSYRQEQRERGCFSPLWVAFSILIGGLMLDVLISITLGVSALPVNIIIGVIVVLGLGTALRLTLEFCYEWSLRRAVQRAVQRRETAFNNIAYPSAFKSSLLREPEKRKSIEMDAKIGKFFDSVGSFFSGGDKIPWSEGDVIAGCEREVREAANSGNEGLKKECLMRLSWALVHSHQQDDVQRGIDMLEASLANSAPPLEDREKLYLLAVGYYRSGDCSKSRQLVDRCIEMQPDWRQALVLKKCIEDKITKDGVIGIGITASAVGAVGLIAGGIVAALARKK
ncbi:unnamed protein product [Brassica rapa subsp. trilocularis]